VGVCLAKKLNTGGIYKHDEMTTKDYIKQISDISTPKISMWCWFTAIVKSAKSFSKAFREEKC